ncbi:hypothetical protein CALCODRAFT_498712 [Calocera cornea HHB12733]|uniref:Xylanolytic transcriptional activator regulatory domain-containing protein n=1 Tax=Calocera cornea HHB12733 TaxID=1353952 RepID=A0A165ER15_9BASI|nr:hypothetical protein CALCODRAFT_498712 [Calocera cornea HHB12733]
MSARMMQSLGLHLDFRRNDLDLSWRDLSSGQKKLRLDVYWITYIQDKLWSLWMGRSAAVHDNERVPLPEVERETDEPRLVFRAYCQLMRVAGKILPTEDPTEQGQGKAVLDAHQLAHENGLPSDEASPLGLSLAQNPPQSALL